MSRRITAWMALLAMLSGLGLPLHAYAQHARAGSPGSDFCAAAKTTNSAPAVPERDHGTACDMCCGCATDGAASAITAYAAVVPSALIAVNHAGTSKHGAAHFASALPRGPPLFS
jgi:hypothetical protein